MAAPKVAIALLCAALLFTAANAAGRGLAQTAEVQTVECDRAAVGKGCNKCVVAGKIGIMSCVGCCADAYLSSVGEAAGRCVCNPGYGYRYSGSYCSKCPKGEMHCDEELSVMMKMFGH